MSGVQQILKQVRVARDIEVSFIAFQHHVPIKLEGLGTVSARLYQFVSRVDTHMWNIQIVPNDCRRNPPTFHAAIYAAGQLLPHASHEKLVYEGQDDPVVNVRQVLQSVARLYRCDPSEIAEAYRRAWPWLLHKSLHTPLPRTFDELENRLKLAGDTKWKQ